MTMALILMLSTCLMACETETPISIHNDATVLNCNAPTWNIDQVVGKRIIGNGEKTDATIYVSKTLPIKNSLRVEGNVKVKGLVDTQVTAITIDLKQKNNKGAWVDVSSANAITKIALPINVELKV
jgi:hypothetical protein